MMRERREQVSTSRIIIKHMLPVIMENYYRLSAYYSKHAKFPTKYGKSLKTENCVFH
jgi:hypothetical protein